MGNDLERLKLALAQRYLVEHEVGRGGMATVYRARDLRHDRTVAVKVLNPELAGAVGPERFLREIALTARLDHPHIIPLLDSGDSDGFLYYVMPFVDGESLRERMNRDRQLPLDAALQITREVADALSYAHSLGIAHRDIKPENILLSAGHARVADFGIARAVEVAGAETVTSLTAAGIAAGTPLYMSPEQAAGDRALDTRSDVYSLGCVAYEMLAGQPPFAGPTANAILAQKMGTVPALRVARPAVPSGVAQAITRALATVPADRFGTASDFAQALERGSTTPALPAPIAQWNHRRTLGIAAAGVLVTLTAGWWALTRSAPVSPRFDSIAVLPLANFTGDPGQQHFVDATHDGLIAELAQISELTVISRQSVLRYRDTEKAVPEIARELNVDALVEGSVFRAGDTVRVTVQLLQALPDERHVWAGSFQEDVAGILALHGQVARAIAERVELTLSPGDVARLERNRAVDPAAYQAWLRGWVAAWVERSVDGCIKHAEDAAAIDPNYAAAYVLTARCHYNKAYFTLTRPSDAYPKVKAAAERAIKLDPLLGEAYGALADYLAIYEWDWPRADRAYQRAVELAPSGAPAHLSYSGFLAAMGRYGEAIEHARRAEELTPGMPQARQQVAFMLYLARRYDEAIAQAQRTIALMPDQPFPHLRLAQAYGDKGMYNESVSAFQKGMELITVEERTRWKGYLARTYGLAGRRGDASRLLAELLELERSRYAPPTAIAVAYLGLGQLDEAMDWFEKAYEIRDPDLFLIPKWHGADPLRSNRRFERLLARMRFPE